jgi:hypothetical protein
VDPRSPRSGLRLGEGAHSAEESMGRGNHEKKVTEGLVRYGLPMAQKDDDVFVKRELASKALESPGHGTSVPLLLSARL